MTKNYRLGWLKGPGPPYAAQPARSSNKQNLARLLGVRLTRVEFPPKSLPSWGTPQRKGVRIWIGVENSTLAAANIHYLTGFPLTIDGALT